MMKDKRIRTKLPVFVAAAIAIAGCVSLLFGWLRNAAADKPMPEFSPFAITAADVGTTFQGTASVDVLPVTETDTAAFYYVGFAESEAEDAEYLAYGFWVPHSMQKAFLRDAEKEDFTFRGELQVCDATMTAQLEETVTTYLKDVYAALGWELPPEDIETSCEMIAPYYLVLGDLPNGDAWIWLGASLLGVAVLVALTAWLGKIVWLVLGSLIVLAGMIVAFLLRNELRTIASVTQVADGCYTMTYYADYAGDDYFAAELCTIDALADWIMKKQLHGLPVPVDVDAFGCSTFAAATADGKPLFGRNYDYHEGDTLLVYTAPEGGYASIGMVDLQLFGVGGETDVKGGSLYGKAMMLAAPYVCMDGVNTAGLGVGILQVSEEEVHQDNCKPDLLIFAAIRGLLDNCSSVEEATAWLNGYDMQMALDCSFHLFIADRSGQSVVVEWLGNRMEVIEASACTNHLLCMDENVGKDSQQRLTTMQTRLQTTNGMLTPAEAMQLLADVSSKKSNYGTEWSCVYDLSDSSVDVCLDCLYDTVLSFDCQSGELHRRP